MNTRKTIRSELNGLLLVTAETYNDLIPDDITEQDLDQIASTIEEARQVTEENLVGLTQAVAEETVRTVKESQAKKESRLKKMVPSDVNTAAPMAVPPAPVYSPPKLEGPTPGLPRAVTEAELAKSTQQIIEGAEEAMKRMSGGHSPGIDSMVDLDPNVGYDHHLEMPIAQKKKLEAGIPINVKPPVKAFGLYPKGEEPVAPPPLTMSGERQALQTIRGIVLPFAKSDDKSLSMLATNILAVIEPVLGPVENFTNPPEKPRG